MDNSYRQGRIDCKSTSVVIYRITEYISKLVSLRCRITGMSPNDPILFAVFLSLAATATAQVARNVRIEGQQFIETKVLLGSAITGI